MPIASKRTFFRSQVPEDCELNQYIQSFTLSSDRVRYVMFTIAVVLVLIYTGYRNQRPDSWFNSYAKVARMAIDIQGGKEMPAGASLTERRQLQAAQHFADTTDEKELKRMLKRFEQAQFDSVDTLRMPFLGIAFHVNDLGILGGIGLMGLMLILTFSMSRQHENLFLSLWKVGEIHGREQRHNDGESQANLFYHALAMAQVFNKPPTLSRWKPTRVSPVYRLAFFIPALLQGLVLWNDFETAEIAFGLNLRTALFGFGFQLVSIAVSLLLGFVCFSYARADDKRWRHAFREINPKWIKEQQPSWFQWVLLKKPARIWPKHVPDSGSYRVVSFRDLRLDERKWSVALRQGTWVRFRALEHGAQLEVLDFEGNSESLRFRKDSDILVRGSVLFFPRDGLVGAEPGSGGGGAEAQGLPGAVADSSAPAG